MHINFVEISFKNFMSYGNDVTRLQFSHGLNSITAKNGEGKSALLLDALAYVLYGKPYRDIKIHELINRTNKKNMLVTCIFLKGNDKYEIRRGLQPDILEIKKNEEILDSFSSKKLNQIEIDKIIGLNYLLFKQIISLAVSYNKPFLSLDAKDKRTLVEQFFNIIVFGQMLKINNKKISTLKIDEKINKNNFSNMSGNVKSLKQNILKFISIQKTFDQEQQNNIKKIENEIEIKTVAFNNLEEKYYNLVEQEQQLLKPDENIVAPVADKELLKNIVKDISNLEYENNKCQKDITFLNNNNICSICHNTLTDEHKNIEINKLQSIISANNEKLITLNEEKILQEKLIEQDKKKNDKFSKISSEKQVVIFQKNSTQDDIKKLQESLQQVKDKKFTVDIEEMVKEYKSKDVDCKVLEEKIKGDEVDIKMRETISELLSENGIKAYFFKKIVPILNVKINEYLKIFELPVRITFNDCLEYKINEYKNINYDVSYMSYSEGEKKRIDIAILFSFISIAKIISNWDCNLLIIDELLDNAVDENGLEKMIECIKNMIYNKESCIYIISHRMSNMNAFKKVITIEKNYNGFSQLKGS